MKKCAIVGAGASGLMAAVIGSGSRPQFTVFERQDRIGRKISASGNGRCNVSNRKIDASRYHGARKTFIERVFAKFGPEETRRFFQEAGVPFAGTDEGRLYPASFQSASIVDSLRYLLGKKEVDLKLRRKVESIVPSGGVFKIITAGREEFFFDSVILSAGSCAFPGLGGSDSGYRLAADLGHSVTPLFPSILPINVPLKKVHTLQGVKWDCELKILVKGRVIDSSAGETLFTSYGLSGPAALNVSRSANRAFLAGEKPLISVDFFPGMDIVSLRNTAEALWKDCDKKASFSLNGIINSRIAALVCEICGFDDVRRVSGLEEADKRRLLEVLKGLELEAGPPRGFGEAVVAAGGVNTEEIDPDTMESRIHPNLYITGELLDVDGDSGGFNLQFAWSTGAIAGKRQQAD